MTFRGFIYNLHTEPFISTGLDIMQLRRLTGSRHVVVRLLLNSGGSPIDAY